MLDKRITANLFLKQFKTSKPPTEVIVTIRTVKMIGCNAFPSAKTAIELSFIL
ncbi:MAG TPA: hypothetical protein VK029_04610 [Pseudogracilibacillus sp.]|nr:hypothetical protein [Pseudogracilibacillus sp.]